MNPQVNTALKKAGALAKELQDNLEVVGKYTYDKLSEVMSDIDIKRHELDNLDNEYQEKKIKAEAEFKLKILADRKKTCEEFARANGLTFVDQEAWDEALERVRDVDKQINAAVAKATNALKKQLETDHKLSTSETQIEIAGLQNRLAQSEAQVAFLNTQIERLNKELEMAGQRIVEVANANSTTVNVEGKK